jgi:hypothetical protein
MSNSSPLATRTIDDADLDNVAGGVSLVGASDTLAGLTATSPLGSTVDAVVASTSVIDLEAPVTAGSLSL